MTKSIDQIASISLFNGLPQNQIEALSRITVEKSYVKGESIFSEDEQATGFYAVISGRTKGELQ